MRRLKLGALLLLLVLALAHTLAWRWAAGRMEAGFAAWAAARRAEGWVVRAGPATRGGWPLGVSLTLPDLAVEGGGAEMPGGLAFGAERALAEVSVLHPRVVTVTLGGAQHLRLGALADIPYRADRLAARFPLVPGGRTADLDAVNLRAGFPEGSLTVALAQLHLDSTPAAAPGEAAIGFAGSAEAVTLPPRTPGWPLGERLASVSVEGAVNGPLPRATDLAARAVAWRDGGGTLEIRRLVLGWGPLGVSGSATLALDERMQPMGAATVRLTGQAAALDAMAANQAITARTAGAAKTVLGLMTRTPEGGGAPEVEAPLTLQKQVLALGRIPLLRLPDWVWPTAP